MPSIKQLPRLGRAPAIARVIALAIGSMFAMCPSVAQTQTLPDDIQIRLAGSSTVGGRLMQEVVTAWARKIGLINVQVNAGMDPDEYEIVANRAESARRLRVAVQAKGSGTGIEPLLLGKADFWMASRPAQDGDVARARARNIAGVPSLAQFTAPGGVEHVVGLDALAVLVNARNPVKRLTLAQMRDLYVGKITNWSQAGGPNLPAALYALEPQHGTNDLFCGVIIGIGDANKCLDGLARLAAPRFAVEDELPEAVAANPAGLGYGSFARHASARAVQIGSECGTGVDAETFQIKADEYPLSRRLYLYAHPTRPSTPTAQALLDFILSRDGQAAVAMAGFGDLNPGFAADSYAADRLGSIRDAQDGGQARIRPSDVHAFQDATAGGNRLSITFRFQAGTNTLDSRAEADLRRLAELMRQPDYARIQLVLIGYSVAAGDYNDNRALSLERAEAVRARLASTYGLQDVMATGVGPAGAVACNLDPRMAGLNQRVEVWLRRKS